MVTKVTRQEAAIINRVIAAREERGLSRADVAEALSLERPSYAHYERGRSAFTVEQLFQLSRILGKPVTWFLGIDTDLADDEAELVHLYRQIDDERMRAMVMNTARDAVRILKGK